MESQGSGLASGLGSCFAQNSRVCTSLHPLNKLSKTSCNHPITHRPCDHLFLRCHVLSSRHSGIFVPRIASLYASGTTFCHTHAVLAPARVLRSKTSRFCEFGLRGAHDKPSTRLPRSDRRSTAAGSRHVCRGSGQGSTEQSLPEEDSDKVQDSSAPVDALEADWRAFRARLVAGEQGLSNSPEPDDVGEAFVDSTTSILGKSWAHPLLVPESGCVLVATEKLDGQIDFERTVVLILRIGSNKPREGPYGIILNRPVLRTINELNPTNRQLANTFGNCQPFHGGPLESDMFLLMREVGENNRFEEVVPGIYYGGSNDLHHAVDLVKDGAAFPQDFRFYIGYTGWDLDQLMNEIETGWWHVAACSPNLIRATSSESLWQEILLLMGGLYADLGRKPKKG